MTAADVRVFTNEADVADELAAFVVRTAKESIDQRGVFTIGFSGACYFHKSTYCVRISTQFV